jgi:hypothetical protein
MVPSGSALQGPSNEWLRQYVPANFICLDFCVLPLVTESPPVLNELIMQLYLHRAW